MATRRRGAGIDTTARRRSAAAVLTGPCGCSLLLAGTMSFVRLPMRSSGAATCHMEILAGKTVADMKDVVAVSSAAGCGRRWSGPWCELPPLTRFPTRRSVLSPSARVWQPGKLRSFQYLGASVGTGACARVCISVRMRGGWTSPSRQPRSPS